MTSEKSGIIFMGTPEFAVGSLKKLIDRKRNVIAVVTAPDKPAGRGMKTSQSAVKAFALEMGIPVFQPLNLKEEAFVRQMRNLNPDLILVVAFRMLPRAIWEIPGLGTVNLHASLLPHYRGAAPINWALINGEKTTGVTTFFIEEQIDTGKILLQRKVSVEETDNAGSLHDRLMKEGADLLDETVDKLLKGEIRAMDQSALLKAGEVLKLAPKLTRDSCKIDWNKSLEEIHHFIRGLSPHPCAWTILNHNGSNIFPVKIFGSSIIRSAQPVFQKGLITDGKDFIRVPHREGFLEITKLQLPGKRQMSAPELLRGFRFSMNDFLL